MIHAKPFSLLQVRLLDGLFKDAMQRDHDYLLRLDPDRLLVNFRRTAGLPTHTDPYGGWESPESELRGHSIGHYLSACALMFASTGNEVFRQRIDHIVRELSHCQDAMPTQGYHPGFLSAYPESFFERVERREPVWAPYYTLHKIMAGLLDAHTLCGSAQALDILLKMADWIGWRVSKLSREEMQITLLNEPGGMNEVLANLYAVTGKPEHLALSLAFDDDVVLNPLANGEDRLDRLHANTQIPKATGAARQYELTGETRFRDIAQFFWDRVANHRSYVIGGNSDDELFFPVDCFADHLSSVTAETCNTYNMLKLTRHIFSWTLDAHVMDFYERGLLNHILASQDPHTGMMLYFASLKPGHVKIYNTPEHSFWCCTGTGMENHAKYADTIYFHAADALYVNLFIASELTWSEKGITLRQETRFPEEDTTRLTLHCDQPSALTLHIRCPGWAGQVNVTINGQPQTVTAAPGSYLVLDRTWHDGDCIEVRLSMPLRLEFLPNDPRYAALMVGPVVLAGALGTDSMPDVYLHDAYTRSTPVNRLPTPPVPALIGEPADLLTQIEPAPGEPLTFRFKGGAASGIPLIPFYRLHHQRYTVYWELRSP